MYRFDIKPENALFNRSSVSSLTDNSGGNEQNKADTALY
ncbi:hypothetical protein [Morganella morganii IS15]|nr:hypothetical protein CSB69_3741 [Morganella morganii]EMP51798.1 hypothetical protein C790_00697 [Morganella morganii SC01]CDK63456.1 hypothetical protein [Morganella morganii IS15]